MSSKPVLKIDWATHEAAKFACENWHYSKTIGIGKLVKVGVWEDGKFIGVIVFGRGANHNIGAPYGLDQTQCIELIRIALTKHQNAVSKMMSIAIRFLKKQSQGIRLIVSYADMEQGHHGGIYQAGNWTYVGCSGISEKVFFRGRWAHKRTVDSIRGNHKGLPVKKTLEKHTYLMPLDNEMRKKVQSLAKPYPKRASSKDIVVPDDQSGEGSESLTDALQVSDDHC
jgi:hypothetical protein